MMLHNWKLIFFRWSYAASKLVDEFYANAYKIENNLKVCIIRFFNTVGPGQPEDMEW